MKTKEEIEQRIKRHLSFIESHKKLLESDIEFGCFDEVSKRAKKIAELEEKIKTLEWVIDV